jgi:hypothetical protein
MLGPAEAGHARRAGNFSPRVRPLTRRLGVEGGHRLWRRTAIVGVLALLAWGSAACGGSGGTSGTNPPAAGGGSKSKGSGGSGHSHKASSSSHGTTSSTHCSLNVILAISGQSTSKDQADTASWVLKSANNWTVFVPSSDWHLSASTAGGADVTSPDGSSDASLGVDESLSPLTYEGLTQQLLAPVSDIHVICQTPNEVVSSQESRATELTGVYRGVPVHIVYALTISAVEPGSEFHGGETRSIFTPVSQWSTSTETTLWLIIKRAIFSPSSP